MVLRKDKTYQSDRRQRESPASKPKAKVAGKNPNELNDGGRRRKKGIPPPAKGQSAPENGPPSGGCRM